MLKIENLSKSYGKHNILNNISLELPAGKCIGIIGANGCGKSTLLSIIAGTLSYNSGTITILDKYPHSAANCSQYIGYVPQENPLFDKLTALDNLKFWYGSDSSQLKEDLSNGLPALFGITEYLKKRVENMSGGMKKRLSIACSLAKHQPILVLDEPCAALDLPCKEDIHNYLRNYLKAGNSVIITSHEESDIAMCDILYLIKDSKISCIDTDTSSDMSALTEYLR
ncbi:MAG: ABC transporter ATP-binding protein [Lachnospiraceae bacterium]|nr:ABC transporter ATP-binding protein [Lachnospiraceae bacterium]